MENQTVVSSSAEHALSKHDIKQYWREGFLIVPGRFSEEEVASWREEVERLFLMPGLRDPLNLRAETRHHEQQGYILDRLDPVLDLSPTFQNLVGDPRITQAVASIFGEEPSLLRCKLIRKTPGTHGYGLHQDYPYWEWMGVPGDDLLSIAISVDHADASSGAMELFAGLHDRKHPPSSDEVRDMDSAVIENMQGVRPHLNPGDMMIFHSLAPHRSSPNRSSHNRTLLLPTFAAGHHGDIYARYHARFIASKAKALTEPPLVITHQEVRVT